MGRRGGLLVQVVQAVGLLELLVERSTDAAHERGYSEHSSLRKEY